MPHKDPQKRAQYFRALYEVRKDDPAYREIQRAAKKKWKKAHPAEVRAGQQRQDLLRKYDLTPEDRALMFQMQEGLCGICSRHMCLCLSRSCLSRAEVDHDHKKEGRESVRGLLCGPCNRGIGQMKDSATLCRNAAAYLEAS